MKLHGTPASIRQARRVVQRTRLLSVPGEVCVTEGQQVAPDAVVARSWQPGRVVPVNVAAALNLSPAEVPGSLVKRVGDVVQAGEVVARTRQLFGLLRSDCLAPCDGSLLAVSELTGQVLVQTTAEPLAVHAYLQGRVVMVVPQRGAVVSCRATFVQGVYGLGGEAWGKLAVVVPEPQMDLTTDQLDASLSGKVVVGGAGVSPVVLERAASLGVVAVVTGSIEAADLAELPGFTGLAGGRYGEAAASSCALPGVLVITEGFGNLPMAQPTFDLLRSRRGATASVSGFTQLRAGVVRPEIVIPWTDPEPGNGEMRSAESAETFPQPAEAVPVNGLDGRSRILGSRVRVIREPHLGRLGRLVALPSEPARLPNGVKTRVAELELEGGQTVTLALANLELA